MLKTWKIFLFYILHLHIIYYNDIHLENIFYCWLIIIIDSLLFGDYSEHNTKDVNCCFETQCNQIFLGMVTMQYQPQYDMVRYQKQNSLKYFL